MSLKSAEVLLFIGFLTAMSAHTNAEEPQPDRQDIKLSADALDLLRAEMIEISGGIQGIALSLAAADWMSIQETSAKIQASYIMEKKLTSEQAEELEKALPEHFKQIDREFHHRAEKLGAAASDHDPELVAFHLYRLIETCTLCHQTYARTRFPGFSPAAQQDHHH